MPSPTCPGCHKRTERSGGLCGWCRAAVTDMKPPRGEWSPDNALADLRSLHAKWVQDGLDHADVDNMARTFFELDRRLSAAGWLPEEWERDEGWEETPVPVRRTEDVRTGLL